MIKLSQGVPASCLVSPQGCSSSKPAGARPGVSTSSRCTCTCDTTMPGTKPPPPGKRGKAHNARVNREKKKREGKSRVKSTLFHQHGAWSHGLSAEPDSPNQRRHMHLASIHKNGEFENSRLSFPRGIRCAGQHYGTAVSGWKPPRYSKFDLYQFLIKTPRAGVVHAAVQYTAVVHK